MRGITNEEVIYRIDQLARALGFFHDGGGYSPLKSGSKTARKARMDDSPTESRVKTKRRRGYKLLPKNFYEQLEGMAVGQSKDVTEIMDMGKVTLKSMRNRIYSHFWKTPKSYNVVRSGSDVEVIRTR